MVAQPPRRRLKMYSAKQAQNAECTERKGVSSSRMQVVTPPSVPSFRCPCLPEILKVNGAYLRWPLMEGPSWAGSTPSCLLTNSVHPLTPSLPQPVKFPGWTMHWRAWKQYIFCSYNTSTFKDMRFLWKFWHKSVRKSTKRLKSFKFRTCIGRFQLTWWQWRG